MITIFLTLRGYWASINEFYLEDTGELIKLAPITYLVDEVNKYIDYLKNKNLGELDTDGLINEFKRFNNLYIRKLLSKKPLM